MFGKPYQSKLNPYRQEIAAWRATDPPTPYQRIAELLKERHGLEVSRHAIWSFVRARSKGRKVYAMQLEDVAPNRKPGNSAEEQPSDDVYDQARDAIRQQAPKIIQNKPQPRTHL